MEKTLKINKLIKLINIIYLMNIFLFIFLLKIEE